MILFSKYIVPRGYTGITIYPFVFLKRRALAKDKTLINHERIHLMQQRELLVIPFYIWYVIEFVIRLIYYKSWHLAYINISFEREAYANQKDKGYLKSRSIWRFLRYI